uniref:Uncharacterized protein n=1 Tax=viral metagenome TaxID=1070528 RepID=A0A6C0LQB7_9ZZZZ
MSINNSYVKCANEHGVCQVTGTKSAAYSKSDGTGTIYYRDVNGNFTCNNLKFGGDPAAGVNKICSLTDIPTVTFVNGIPSGFTKCADEGNMCDPKNSAINQIFFGANNKYTFANANLADCNTKIFGDPIKGINKACYYRKKDIEPPIETPPDEEKTPVPKIGMNTTTKVLIGIGIGLLVILFIIVAIIIAKHNSN